MLECKDCGSTICSKCEIQCRPHPVGSDVTTPPPIPVDFRFSNQVPGVRLVAGIRLGGTDIKCCVTGLPIRYGELHWATPNAPGDYPSKKAVFADDGFQKNPLYFKQSAVSIAQGWSGYLPAELLEPVSKADSMKYQQIAAERAQHETLRMKQANSAVIERENFLKMSADAFEMTKASGWHCALCKAKGSWQDLTSTVCDLSTGAFHTVLPVLASSLSGKILSASADAKTREKSAPVSPSSSASARSRSPRSRRSPRPSPRPSPRSRRRHLGLTKSKSALDGKSSDGRDSGRHDPEANDLTIVPLPVSRGGKARISWCAGSDAVDFTVSADRFLLTGVGVYVAGRKPPLTVSVSVFVKRPGRGGAMQCVGRSRSQTIEKISSRKHKTDEKINLVTPVILEPRMRYTVCVETKAAIGSGFALSGYERKIKIRSGKNPAFITFDTTPPGAPSNPTGNGSTVERGQIPKIYIYDLSRTAPFVKKAIHYAKVTNDFFQPIAPFGSGGSGRGEPQPVPLLTLNTNDVVKTMFKFSLPSTSRISDGKNPAPEPRAAEDAGTDPTPNSNGLESPSEVYWASVVSRAQPMYNALDVAPRCPHGALYRGPIFKKSWKCKGTQCVRRLNEFPGTERENVKVYTCRGAVPGGRHGPVCSAKCYLCEFCYEAEEEKLQIAQADCAGKCGFVWSGALQALPDQDRKRFELDEKNAREKKKAAKERELAASRTREANSIRIRPIVKLHTYNLDRTGKDAVLTKDASWRHIKRQSEWIDVCLGVDAPPGVALVGIGCLRPPDNRPATYDVQVFRADDRKRRRVLAKSGVVTTRPAKATMLPASSSGGKLSARGGSTARNTVRSATPNLSSSPLSSPSKAPPSPAPSAAQSPHKRVNFEMPLVLKRGVWYSIRLDQTGAPTQSYSQLAKDGYIETCTGSEDILVQFRDSRLFPGERSGDSTVLQGLFPRFYFMSVSVNTKITATNHTKTPSSEPRIVPQVPLRPVRLAEAPLLRVTKNLDTFPGSLGLVPPLQTGMVIAVTGRTGDLENKMSGIVRGRIIEPRLARIDAYFPCEFLSDPLSQGAERDAIATRVDERQTAWETHEEKLRSRVRRRRSRSRSRRLSGGQLSGGESGRENSNSRPASASPSPSRGRRSRAASSGSDRTPSASPSPRRLSGGVKGTDAKGADAKGPAGEETPKKSGEPWVCDHCLFHNADSQSSPGVCARCGLSRFDSDAEQQGNMISFLLDEESSDDDDDNVDTALGGPAPSTITQTTAQGERSVEGLAGDAKATPATEALQNDMLTGLYFMCQRSECGISTCLRCLKQVPAAERTTHDCDGRLGLLNLYKHVISIMASASSQKCPKCQRPGLKDLACTHISCQCGISWCYMCGGNFGRSFGDHNSWYETVKGKKVKKIKYCPQYLKYIYDDKKSSAATALHLFHVHKMRLALDKYANSLDEAGRDKFLDMIARFFPEGILKESDLKELDQIIAEKFYSTDKRWLTPAGSWDWRKAWLARQSIKGEGGSS